MEYGSSIPGRPLFDDSVIMDAMDIEGKFGHSHSASCLDLKSGE